jgi:putative peptide zinc metalloprotease protein
MTVTLRSDLQVSRQVYQNEPVYVVHDPVSFRSHRLSAFQYRLLAMLCPELKLHDNFQSLVAKQELTVDQEEFYYQMVSSFGRLGLLVLPGNNGAKLYLHHQRVSSLKRRSRFLGFLFLQIPLVNLDQFLTRTADRVSWLFTRTFLAFWVTAMFAAGVVVVSRFGDLVQPFNGILAMKNLPFLWVTFVALKIWHELGHGYACKAFGGHVPEMGAILIAGTPAAYVDASSAWSFPECYKRLVVMCGGMFFESLIFIPCVFVWASSNSPMLQSCAYQLLVMASLVTLLFNANPLMKFDGYFILSELIGIQNLRPKADARIKSVLASLFLGFDRPITDGSAFRSAALVSYGVSATIYRFFLVISIAMMVAIRFPLIGLLLAAFHVITTVGTGAIKMARYLLTNPETDAVRGRGRLIAATVFIGLPLAACILPVPFGIVTQGTVGARSEYFINVKSPGELVATIVSPGDYVDAETPLVRLVNERTDEELRVAQASLQQAKTQWEVARERGTVPAAKQRTSIAEHRKRVEEYTRRVRQLSVPSPAVGQVVNVIAATERGRFLREGHPLAVVVSGRPVLRTWVTEDVLGAMQSERETAVTFRIPGRSTTSFEGHIISVLPAADVAFRETSLTHMGGGTILVDPVTGAPLEPVFQINIEPAADVVQLTEHGARVHLNLPRRYESIAAWATRKCIRFVHKLLVA